MLILNALGHNCSGCAITIKTIITNDSNINKRVNRLALSHSMIKPSKKIKSQEMPDKLGKIRRLFMHVLCQPHEKPGVNPKRKMGITPTQVKTSFYEKRYAPFIQAKFSVIFKFPF
jgi:hypothetical protein